MKDFRKLQVWEKAHSLSLAVYGITAAVLTAHVIEVKEMLAALIQRIAREQPSSAER